MNEYVKETSKENRLPPVWSGNQKSKNRAQGIPQQGGKRYHVSVDQILFGEAVDGKTTARRQLDALADDLNDTEIGIIIATARALLDAREKGE